MKKVLAILLCVVLAGLLMMGIRLHDQEEQRQAAALEELNQRIEPLYARQLELQTELAGLDDAYSAMANGMATLSLLIDDLDPDFLRLAAPALEEAQVPAVFALTAEQFPGESGCISAEEFRQYMDKGWGYCLVWDQPEDTDFDQWYDRMAERLARLDLTMPEALCFMEGTYTDEREEAARDRGFTVAVHTGENGRPLIATETGEMWRPGAVSWLSAGVKGRLEQAVTSYGSIVFVVGRDADGSFDEPQFRSMLEVVQSYQKEESLLVAVLEEAKAYREGIDREKESYQDEALEARKAELEQEIESLREQIRQIGEQG